MSNSMGKHFPSVNSLPLTCDEGGIIRTATGEMVAIAVGASWNGQLMSPHMIAKIIVGRVGGDIGISAPSAPPTSFDSESAEPSSDSHVTPSGSFQGLDDSREGLLKKGEIILNTLMKAGYPVHAIKAWVHQLIQIHVSRYYDGRPGLRRPEWPSAFEPEPRVDQRTFDRVVEERNDADRRAGAAERNNASLQDNINRRGDWLAKAKKEAGYPDDVSFDIVWQETLAKARKVDELEKTLAYNAVTIATSQRFVAELAKRGKITRDDVEDHQQICKGVH